MPTLLQRLFSIALAISCAIAASTSVQAATPATPTPAQPPDATHPRVMQEAGNQVATATPSAARPQAQTATPNASQAPSTVEKEVFGFALASSLSDSMVGYPSWDFSLLSTVAFFGLHTDDHGAIVADSGWTVWGSSQLTNLVAAAHAHGTKVVVTIIQQDFASGTPHMCSALNNRAATVTQLVAQVNAKGVDGVNIDYEGLNGTCPNGQTARAMMTDFAHQLRSALPAGSYLSVDTYASSAIDSAGFFDVPGLKPYVDSFFVMAYDLEYSNYYRAPLNCSSFCLGPTSPLTGYYYNDTTTAAQYVTAVGASKVILGIPYYGRKACVANATANAKPTGAVTADTYLDAIAESSQPEVQAGSYAIHHDAHDPTGQERWDTWVNTSLNCTRELYWDDTISLGKKYDLVNSKGLRGVGIWNLNYGGGATELWTSLYNHFAACQSAGLSASPAGPQTPGTAVQLTASSTGCFNTRYKFFVQAPGGPWVAKTSFQLSTWTWSTTGLKPGVYGIGVWVRHLGSARPYESYFLGTYTLTFPNCTNATLNPGTAPPQAPGASITFTGAAAGCPGAQYRFWLLPPGGTWTMQRDWGASTWTWNTTGRKAGTYQLGVWARQPGTSNAYDAYAFTTYALGSATCISAGLTPGVAPPQAPGASITFTASSNSCTSPQYQFWLLPPGGAWTVKQPFSATATWAWNTSGLTPGTYRVGVWVKKAGSTSAYNAYFVGTYRLNVQTCASAAIADSPDSPQPVGSVITFTATSTGCGTPQYEFWKLPPSSSTWTVAQPYGAGNTFTFDTGGAAPGPYQVGVWARQSGSPSAYDSYAILTYWLTS